MKDKRWPSERATLVDAVIHVRGKPYDWTVPGVSRTGYVVQALRHCWCRLVCQRPTRVFDSRLIAEANDGEERGRCASMRKQTRRRGAERGSLGRQVRLAWG